MAAKATKYYAVNLDLSDPKITKLIKGTSITARAGNHPVHVTKSQKTALMKAHKAGKGAALTLSKRALYHNLTHGSGIFSDILKTVARAVLPTAASALGKLTGSETVGKIAEAVGDKGLSYLGAGMGGKGFKGPGY